MRRTFLEFRRNEFVFTLHKPEVNDIDTDILISARDENNHKVYNGTTDGWSSCIESFDLHRMCKDGFEGSDSSVLSITYPEDDNDEVNLRFDIISYAFCFYFSAKLKFTGILHKGIKEIKQTTTSDDISEIKNKLDQLKKELALCQSTIDAIKSILPE